MSGWGRKHASKEYTHHYSSVNSKSASSYRGPEPLRFNADSRRSDQHSGEARSRNRVAQNYDISYYDETRQHYFYHRAATTSNSRSRSRSRSPFYRSRRDTGSYDRHNKTTTQVLPLPIREFYKRGTDHQFAHQGWENKIRKPRETKYHTDDYREEVMKKGVRSFDCTTDGGTSDPRLARRRNELTEEKETQRRDGDGEGEFRRSSNISCKFFAAGFCRNGKQCRFSHHGADRKQSQDNNFYKQHNNNHSGHNNKWNDAERFDNRKFGEMEVSRASKGIPESKGNGRCWIDNMEMSPDWNYGTQSLENVVKEEHGVDIIDQSSQSLVPKDNMGTKFEQKSTDMLSYGDKPTVEKPIATSHHNHNNPVNIAPAQAFNQNTQNHNALLYQSSLTTVGSQQVVAAGLPLGSNLTNPENGKVYQDYHHSVVENTVPVQNTVTREQIDQISSISASIAQFLANGQPIPQLQQALQMTLHSESSVAVQPNQAATALLTQSITMSDNPNQLCGLGASTGGEGVPVVTASQVISNIDKSQEVAGNPKLSEEKKTDKANKEGEGEKNGEDTNDAENVLDEDDDDDGSDEENKKEKDPKGMRAFKFALVEIVKELLKPAWKEGKMNKDGYKNIVKKVVEKVSGTMQNGNVPQTQDKIDHYLSASKPKLTKLVQAYISKVKKS